VIAAEIEDRAVGTRAGIPPGSVRKSSDNGRNHFASADYFGLPIPLSNYFVLQVGHQ